MAAILYNDNKPNNSGVILFLWVVGLTILMLMFMGCVNQNKCWNGEIKSGEVQEDAPRRDNTKVFKGW